MDEIAKLFAAHGSSDYIGEAISQLEHAIQAAEAAEEEHCPDFVVIAALLHDIGHLLGLQGESERMGVFGVMSHEKIASEYLLKAGFDPRVCELILNHVNAKRYLVAKYPEYHANLSEASKNTLIYQGGAMNEAEMKAFESNPLFEYILKMRGFDEAAKVKDKKIKPLEYYYPMMEKLMINKA